MSQNIILTGGEEEEEDQGYHQHDRHRHVPCVFFLCFVFLRHG